jgi:hypothetical protein
MRSFLMTKADKCKWTHGNAAPSKTMMKFINDVMNVILCDASASDRNTFALALMHLEATISSNFTRKLIQKGWEVAGLVDLSFHKVMSHWLGYINMRAEDINGLVSLLPCFLHEMATSFSLSDRSMAAMQRFFPMDFKMYPTDRNTLGLPRQRAVLMSWLVEFHNQQAIDAVHACVEDVLEDEVRPMHPVLDPQGKAICPCARGGFRGKHYVDSDEGWNLHCLTAPHKKWRAAQRGESQSESVLAASDLEWMQQSDCVRVKAICLLLNLNVQIGKKIVAFQLKDNDLQSLRYFPTQRMISMFGIAPAQVVLIRQHLDGTLPLTVGPDAHPEALLPRTSTLSQLHFPAPTPYVPMQQVPTNLAVASASFAPPFTLLPNVLGSGAAPPPPPPPPAPPITQALFSAGAATQPRVRGGQFGKKR